MWVGGRWAIEYDWMAKWVGDAVPCALQNILLPFAKEYGSAICSIYDIAGCFVDADARLKGRLFPNMASAAKATASLELAREILVHPQTCLMFLMSKFSM